VTAASAAVADVRLLWLHAFVLWLEHEPVLDTESQARIRSNGCRSEGGASIEPIASCLALGDLAGLSLDVKSSHGMITHLRANTPSGRVVEHSDGTVVVGWEDEAEEGRRGVLAITSDGRGAVAICETQEQAAVEVCEELGLDKGFIIGGDYSRT
jgi:hypothetical protein